MQRDRTLISATKSNALNHSMVFWDEVVAAVAPDYPEVTVRNMHVDALAALMVLHPERVDTIVASNLFGDILTDLGAALMGSLGLAPSANIDPTNTLSRACSSPSTARRRTSPGGASPTRWRRSGRARCCWSTWARQRRPHS